ncbi:transcriptional regulator [Vallitalea longa]|uniref:Transcriptional regulator n=1 Tax=Vallitalea longa TaxID=2936439 RepID=A0A9W5YEC2_9FIRM|nr:metalloregulator ArsR/SmtB family transcription factor [Vallitalea longa]GKX31499.1 transcriptional regulator [Vallitalea longa]
MRTEEEKNKCCKDDNFISDVKTFIADEETMYQLADFFKNFGDSTRVRIMGALFNGEMCVSTIANVLNMTQSAVSHQLRVLKGSRLVKSRKEGKLVYYSLNDTHIEMIYKMGMEHILE